MKRREFIALACGVTFVWPLEASAQQPDMIPTVGFLVAGTPASHGQWVAAFIERLRELGWTKGRNLAIEVRWAEGHNERFAEFAAEFVRLNVSVIVTAGGAALAAKQATSVIPIVFAVAGDPIGAGLVASLAHPGGNVTGLSLQQSDVSTKRLELLREISPTLRRLAVLANVDNPAALFDMHEIQVTAKALNIDVVTMEIRQALDISPAFETIKSRADALYICGEALVVANRSRISGLALAARLPTVADFPEYAEAGGLMTYGPNFTDLYRRAAEYVDKILRGAKPADIPVEQPTKFDFVLNLKTAKALSITVPATLLTRADRVIE